MSSRDECAEEREYLRQNLQTLERECWDQCHAEQAVGRHWDAIQWSNNAFSIQTLLMNLDALSCSEVRDLAKALKEDAALFPSSEEEAGVGSTGGKVSGGGGTAGRVVDGVATAGAIAGGVGFLGEKAASALIPYLERAEKAAWDGVHNLGDKGLLEAQARLMSKAVSTTAMSGLTKALKKALAKTGGPLSALGLATSIAQQYQLSHAQTVAGKVISAAWATIWSYGFGVLLPAHSAVDGLVSAATGYSVGNGINRGIDQVVVFYEGVGISAADAMFALINGREIASGSAMARHRSGANGPLPQRAAEKGGYWVEHGRISANY
jgi:hypothetical protein